MGKVYFKNIYFIGVGRNNQYSDSHNNESKTSSTDSNEIQKYEHDQIMNKLSYRTHQDESVSFSDESKV